MFSQQDKIKESLRISGKGNDPPSGEFVRVHFVRPDQSGDQSGKQPAVGRKKKHT